MRFKLLVMVIFALCAFYSHARAESPGALTPLFKNNDDKCIPEGIRDLPAFKGNQSVLGSCKVTIVVTGLVKEVSDFYAALYQKRGWDLANRLQMEQENRFTVQKKKKLMSVSFVQVSPTNTAVEFTY